MDALEILKSDHERVKDLFEQYRSASEVAYKRQVMELIQRDLRTHAHVEETVFYPSLRKYPECSGIISRSFEEHRQVTEMLDDLADMEKNLDDSRVDDLIQAVESHVAEEENQLFHQVRRLMKRPEREVLGRHMTAARQDFKNAQKAAKTPPRHAA